MWYTAPTAIRMLIKAGPELAAKFRFPSLRFVASVGEPLNAEAVWWGKRVLGLPIHDNWWQTETGGIMVANTPAFDIKPGSMGRPLPGVDACVVRRGDDGTVSVIEEPDVEGELALKPGWPSMFREYLHQEERYRKSFAGGFYLTRRPGQARRRRLLLVRRPRRRRDQVRRAPDRAVRGGERPDRSPRGGRGGGDRQARPHRRRGGEGLRHAQGRFHRRRRVCGCDAARPRAKAAGCGGGAQGDRVRRRAAAHPQRQDHAAAAEGPRTRPARGRHLHRSRRPDVRR